jgi:hypothetical protein
MQWAMNEWLEDLEYADDVCPLAHKFTDIKGKLNYSLKIAKAAGRIECDYF